MRIHAHSYSAQKGYPAMGLMRWVVKGKRTWKINGFWVRWFNHRGFMVYGEGHLWFRKGSK